MLNTLYKASFITLFLISTLFTTGCDDTNKRQCEECKGTGKISGICASCNGDGRKIGTSGEITQPLKCGACNGTGSNSILCNKCGGKGYFLIQEKKQ